MESLDFQQYRGADLLCWVCESKEPCRSIVNDLDRNRIIPASVCKLQIHSRWALNNQRPEREIREKDHEIMRKEFRIEDDEISKMQHRKHCIAILIQDSKENIEKVYQPIDWMKRTNRNCYWLIIGGNWRSQLS